MCSVQIYKFLQWVSFGKTTRCCHRALNYSTWSLITRRVSGGESGNMATVRLVQFEGVENAELRVGVELGNGGAVVDITNVDATIPKDMRTFLQSWESNLAAALR